MDKYVLDSDYISQLLVNDAKSLSANYKSHGVSGVVNHRPYRDKASKPNAAFLSKMVQGVEAHNKELRRRDEQSTKHHNSGERTTQQRSQKSSSQAVTPYELGSCKRRLRRSPSPLDRHSSREINSSNHPSDILERSGSGQSRSRSSSSIDSRFQGSGLDRRDGDELKRRRTSHKQHKSDRSHSRRHYDSGSFQSSSKGGSEISSRSSIRQGSKSPERRQSERKKRRSKSPERRSKTMSEKRIRSLEDSSKKGRYKLENQCFRAVENQNSNILVKGRGAKLQESSSLDILFDNKTDKPNESQPPACEESNPWKDTLASLKGRLKWAKNSHNSSQSNSVGEYEEGLVNQWQTALKKGSQNNYHDEIIWPKYTTGKRQWDKDKVLD
ncbi:hypothetical protein NADFUDRAFT_49478 [Nadsonia fulvescens var. elongata DSM 6958]|uniref:Uncharacterized protein n=1 Tax=Nadsonia fulvescens var. elongata DSM 6958 TaxID=857566 RepID=A0A1E3PNZ5_9ASCO|nr:hypothetical protein NADFUDRAFT_49478 [Nadsonia fulvescens var. elongata DSM 6958]